MVTYVVPPRRIPAQQPTAATPSEPIVAEPEKDAVPVEKDAVEKPVSQKVPFPEHLEKTKEEKQYAKFLETMREVQITIPILDAVLHIPLYAKFFKDLITKKRSLEDPEIVALTEECSAVIQNNLPKKLGDLGSFSIPCVV